ncbi:KGG domain-containing protein [Cytobacillus purgationiresistens]|uniref:General stress protein YciG n=1 Tax=Cytobacillus purgationiresistens TaxID=863449 RepID=A0ABU0AA83_9BACI|nr:KGG domain-containing protein [Cytobacillus purgationiresistens]MDQ0268150.1 general stress protein YciG [Cytobacillus purgationiresistens]
MATNKTDKMTREEAGKKGGEATSKNHDKDYYQEIGEKGGKSSNN